MTMRALCVLLVAGTVALSASAGAQPTLAAARAGVSAPASPSPGRDGGGGGDDWPDGSYHPFERVAAIALVSGVGWATGAAVGGLVWLREGDDPAPPCDFCASDVSRGRRDDELRFVRGVAVGAGIGTAITMGAMGRFYQRCSAGGRLARAALGAAAGSLPAVIVYQQSRRERDGFMSERYEQWAALALPVGQVGGGALALHRCYGPRSR